MDPLNSLCNLCQLQRKKITRASLTQLELILPEQDWKAGEEDKKKKRTHRACKNPKQWIKL